MTCGPLGRCLRGAQIKEPPTTPHLAHRALCLVLCALSLAPPCPNFLS